MELEKLPPRKSLIKPLAGDMQIDFKLAASALIEVNPYNWSERAVETFRIVNVSSLIFSAGRLQEQISDGIPEKIL